MHNQKNKLDDKRKEKTVCKHCQLLEIVEQKNNFQYLFYELVFL